MQINNHLHNSYEAKVYAKGIIKIPTSIRDELQVHDGDKVLFLRKDDTWVLTTHLKNIAATQKLINLLKHDSNSVMDELIESRRDEAKREFEL
jgi:AbrB family looped-hinge helix DNA binding protein